MSGLTETVYLSSPIWAQQTVVAIYGWWWYKRRFNRRFHRLVTEFNQRESWIDKQFLVYQKNQLQKLFAAASNSLYYRERFAEADITREMDPFEALRRAPILSKERLRSRPRDLLTENPLPKGTVIFKSSGTTGTPTEIYYTPEFHALESAVAYARSLRWAGLSLRNRRVMFGARKVCSFGQEKPPFWRYSPAENMAYASIYHLSPKFLPYYLEFLRSYRPAVVMGYPSALHTLARYALEYDDLPAPAVSVITTSETVSAQAREDIESAWRCRLWDRYGAVEGCLFASQCEYGRYHVTPEIGLVEILDQSGNPLPPGTPGEVVCTGLQNKLQPLIRYRLGDVAQWAVDQSCACGRQMRILEDINGRVEDICFTPDGREMLRFDTVFKGIKNIREAQIVQEKIDLFTVYVVATEEFEQTDAERIRRNMRLHVGNVRTNVITIDRLSRDPSGKFRAVISRLSASEKRRLRAGSSLLEMVSHEATTARANERVRPH